MSNKLDVNKIKEFIDDSINKLTTTDYTCCEYKLDNDLSLFVGWSGGYEPEPDDTIIYDKDDPSFAINIGIKSNHEYMKTDFDWLTSPYDAETEETWDTDMTVPKGGLSEADVKWYIEQYQEIRKSLDAGEIVLENKKVEESSGEDEEEVSFQEIEDMMDTAEDYSDLYEAASYIKNTDLRIDVENLIGVCEDDEDEIDQAVSVVTSDLIDMYINDKNVENLKENKKIESKPVIQRKSNGEKLNEGDTTTGELTMQQLNNMKENGCGNNDSCYFGTPKDISNNLDSLVADEPEYKDQIKSVIDNLIGSDVKYIIGYGTDNEGYNKIYELTDNGKLGKLLVSWYGY